MRYQYINAAMMPLEMERVMIEMFSKANWAKKRGEYLEAARGCRDTLTNPNGYWRYDRNDERVKKALTFWIDRARNAHEFALGRKAIIGNMVVINGGQGAVTAIYAE